MDLKRRVIAAKVSEEKEKADDVKVSERPLSTNLFDALFTPKKR